uniref:Uncharacterized protein n=1 Tax=Anguilla anguilla TaxID=7936 RepID=A0A0E9TS33_ANGAN
MRAGITRLAHLCSLEDNGLEIRSGHSGTGGDTAECSW